VPKAVWSHGLELGGRGHVRHSAARTGLVIHARRVVRLAPETPCYVLGIVPRRRMLRSQTSKAWIELRNAIAAQARSPGEVYVYLPVGELKRLKGRLEPLRGAELI
jgi:hypothetical protein